MAVMLDSRNNATYEILKNVSLFLAAIQVAFYILLVPIEELCLSVYVVERRTSMLNTVYM